SPEEIAEIRDTFMEQNAQGPVPGLSEIKGEYSSDDPLSFYPRMMQPHHHPELPVGSIAWKYMLDQRLRPFLTDCMGDEPVAVQSMFYFKPPKARGQELHQDNYYLRVTPGTCWAAWIAVDDADIENGGMKVVPGSHELDIACPTQADSATSFTTDYVRPPEGMKAVHIDLKAGDVFFFNGNVIHGSSPNTSETRFRRSLICHYVPLGSEAVGKWYGIAMTTFDGEKAEIPEATGSGPCGTPQPAQMH
ncbi:MAG TPA: phytanoyl-CoA dioxygenase family protein, partial [Roseimicrobium sp.]|nr:phytanoyl-CoA dioxygenase family protein [Roseimicrobium sp.]